MKHQDLFCIKFNKKKKHAQLQVAKTLIGILRVHIKAKDLSAVCDCGIY